MRYDRVIKNGMIVDGTRVPRYRADIAIKNGKIARIGSGAICSYDSRLSLATTGNQP